MGVGSATAKEWICSCSCSTRKPWLPISAEMCPTGHVIQHNFYNHLVHNASKNANAELHLCILGRGCPTSLRGTNVTQSTGAGAEMVSHGFPVEREWERIHSFAFPVPVLLPFFFRFFPFFWMFLAIIFPFFPFSFHSHSCSGMDFWPFPFQVDPCLCGERLAQVRPGVGDTLPGYRRI